MSETKRYALQWDEMTENPEGDYVSYADFVKLKFHNAKLSTLARGMRDVYQEADDGGPDTEAARGIVEMCEAALKEPTRAHP